MAELNVSIPITTLSMNELNNPIQSKGIDCQLDKQHNLTICCLQEKFFKDAICVKTQME